MSTRFRTKKTLCSKSSPKKFEPCWDRIEKIRLYKKGRDQKKNKAVLQKVHQAAMQPKASLIEPVFAAFADGRRWAKSRESCAWHMIILTILTGCSNRRYKEKVLKNIRVLIGILGLDQHEVGAVAVARMLGMPAWRWSTQAVFNLPAMIVQTALQEDVDVIGLSVHSWEHIYYLPELMSLLEKQSQFLSS
jgi:methanogenic corrinoid protein MtbC1